MWCSMVRANNGGALFFIHHFCSFMADWVANMKTHASEHPSDAIFATMHPATLRHVFHQNIGEWDSRVDFVVSNDFFATHRILVPRGNRFLFSERYLSVAQVRAAAWVAVVLSPYDIVLRSRLWTPRVGPRMLLLM